MRLFLQLAIGDWREAAYQKPFLHYASSLASDIVGAELDSQSEATIVDLLVRLCNESDSIFVLLIANAETGLGSTERVLAHLVTISDRVHTVIISGGNASTDRILAPLGNKVVNVADDSEIREQIKLFADLR